ncbi:MAG: type II toxin-antitoxin system VapC family toxin [Thermoanaerobaculia bacterium]
MIVADTNLVCYLLIEGERTAAARSVWQRDSQWILPPLWRSEFLNVLALAVRSSILTIDQANRTWHHAAGLFKGCEYDPEGEAVLRTAVRTGLSAYDAQFVVVAEELSVTLVTGDREIARACPDIADELEDFAAGDG